MKNLTWQNPEQLFVAQELINKVKSKCCGIKDKLKLRFLPEKKLKVAEAIDGEYYKMDDGSIIEDSYKFYKVEDEDVYYENEFWTVDKSISIVIRLSSDRNRLEKYYINKDKEELNSIERYVLKSKEDEKSEKLPSWLK